MATPRIRNLLKYVVPTVLGNCCFFLFTIIDGVFVGHGVGTDALGAVNLAMPFVMTVNALFMLTTIGGVTVAAIRLGRNDEAGANQAFLHASAGTLVLSLFLCLAGTLFSGQISSLLGADETFRPLVKDYLFWYSLFIVPSGLSFTLQGFCRNDGAPVLVSAAVAVSTAVNIFGDWLLVFPLGMGLKGAAIATGVSQTVALLIVLPHFLLKKGRLRFEGGPANAALVRKILLRGLPETIAQFATPVTTLCMNYVLLKHLGGMAVNAYSIICYVASFSMAIFFGTAEGLQPLFGQSYGAKNERDLHFYFRAGTLINLFGSIGITALLLFAGRGVCALFGADEETLTFTVTHMLPYSWGFVVMSLNTMISSYLYSTKRTREAIAINVLRSFILDTAFILLLPLTFGSGIVWYTFGLYEAAVLVAAFVLLKRSERNGIVYR